MDKYKKTLKCRIAVMTSVNVFFIILMVLNFCNVIKSSISEDFGDFLQGFQIGIMAVVIILFTYLTIRYVTTLKDEVNLKKLYYSEKDERSILIRSKSGGNVMFVCATFFIMAAAIAGYFNEVVFFTLLICGMFLYVVRKMLLTHYNKIL